MPKDAPSAKESTAKMMQALIEYLPGLTDVTNALVGPTAQAQAAADAAASPIYAQSNLDLYKRFGPEMNQVGSSIDRANQLAAAETEKQIASGVGRENVALARELQGVLDPEWEALRQQLGSNIGNLITGMGDPNKLSEAEQEAISRGIGRQGFKNPNSAADAVEAGATFGDALNRRQDRFTQAYSTLVGAIPGLRSGYSGFEVATKRALAPNSGDARTGTTLQNTGQQAYNMSNQLQNNIAGFQQLWASKQKDALDQADQIMGIVGKGMSAVGSMAAAF